MEILSDLSQALLRWGSADFLAAIGVILLMAVGVALLALPILVLLGVALSPLVKKPEED